MSDTSSNSSITIVADGDIDAETSPLLTQRIADAIDAGAVEIIIDASAVTFMSSAGLSSLIGGHRDAPSFRLLPGNRTVDHLITLTGLERLYGNETSGGTTS